MNGDDQSSSDQPRRRLNDELVEMARCLAEVGPNINEIARRTGQFKETVRYRYHRFFLKNGITIQAVPNYARLGFKRLILVAKLNPACEVDPKSIFNALSDFCYLHSFTRVLLTGEYVIHVAVPSELAERCAAVYRALRDARLFTELEILAFEEMRNPPMKPEFFDFTEGTWSSGWTLAPARGAKLPLSATRLEKYDKIDLLVLKELDIDAGRTLVKMAENVKVNLGALEFHFRDHVKARELFKGYRLVWQGTGYDVAQEKALSRKDFYIELTILLTGGTQAEVAELMLLLNRTPFLWSEAYGSAYCAEIFLPNYACTEFLEYIDKLANKLGRKLRVLFMDQSQTKRFVITYSLFDGSTRKWGLDSDAVLKTLGSMAPTVRDSFDLR
jgi:hypothetical protein